MPTNSLYIRDKTRPPRGCTAQRFATARDKRFWPNTSWPSSWRVRRTPPPPRLSIGKSWCCVLAQVRGEMRVSTKCQQILYTFVTKRGHPEGGGPTFCHSEGINVFGRTPRLSIGKSWCHCLCRVSIVECVLAQVRGEMRVATKCQQILYTFVTKRPNVLPRPPPRVHHQMRVATKCQQILYTFVTKRGHPEGAPPDEGGHKMPTNSLYIRDKTRPPRGWRPNVLPQRGDKRFWPNTSSSLCGVESRGGALVTVTVRRLSVGQARGG